MDLLGDRARINLRSWQIRTNLAHREIRDRQPSITGPRAVIEDSLFYSGCEIRGKVSRSLLFPGVKVEEGAVVEDSILFFDTVVKREAHVARTIADIEVAIGPKSKIGSRDGELSVIGMGSSVPDDVTIQPGVTVYPGVEAAHFTRKEYKTGEIVK
jgi:glucose-1-phosphate adenylyltransferase